MTKELSILVKRLNELAPTEPDLIHWGSPVPSFGSLSSAKIATLGLNPSNREFVDSKGQELAGNERRFHTLNSLGLNDWSQVNEEHLTLIWNSCEQYFHKNPYDTWFKKLDELISGTRMSYYFPSGKACHLDLIPYATACKWTDLTSEKKTFLLEAMGDSLGLLLNSSPIELLVLNGKTVVETLERISATTFEKTYMPDWTLPRKSGAGVAGFSYKGIIKKIGGIELCREITILGYNHNIQSSFGVTKQVQLAIRKWIENSSKEVLQ